MPSADVVCRVKVLAVSEMPSPAVRQLQSEIVLTSNQLLVCSESAAKLNLKSKINKPTGRKTVGRLRLCDEKAAIFGSSPGVYPMDKWVMPMTAEPREFFQPRLT